MAEQGTYDRIQVIRSTEVQQRRVRDGKLMGTIIIDQIRSDDDLHQVVAGIPIGIVEADSKGVVVAACDVAQRLARLGGSGSSDREREMRYVAALYGPSLEGGFYVPANRYDQVLGLR